MAGSMPRWPNGPCTMSRRRRYCRAERRPERPLGDAPWAWARKGLSTDIASLVAVSLARWGHATRAHRFDREPTVYF